MEGGGGFLEVGQTKNRVFEGKDKEGDAYGEHSQGANERGPEQKLISIIQKSLI